MIRQINTFLLCQSMMVTQLHGEGCCKMQLSANVYQVEEQSLLRVCLDDAPDLKGYEQN